MCEFSCSSPVPEEYRRTESKNRHRGLFVNGKRNARELTELMAWVIPAGAQGSRGGEYNKKQKR